MRTAGFCPPLIVTNPTPDSWEILGARRVSARSSTADNGSVGDDSDNVTIGVSAGFTLLYRGGVGRSTGRNVPLALIDCCTSCSATSMLSSRSNCSVMIEMPAELDDVICCSPGIWPNCRSSGAVTEDAITSGPAPGYVVAT